MIFIAIKYLYLKIMIFIAMKYNLVVIIFYFLKRIKKNYCSSNHCFPITCSLGFGFWLWLSEMLWAFVFRLALDIVSCQCVHHIKESFRSRGWVDLLSLVFCFYCQDCFNIDYITAILILNFPFSFLLIFIIRKQNEF